MSATIPFSGKWAFERSHLRRSLSLETVVGKPDVLLHTEARTEGIITLEPMYRYMAGDDPRLAHRVGRHPACCNSHPPTHAVRNRAKRAVELALEVLSSFVGPADVASYAGGTGLFASMLMSSLSPNRAAEVKIRLFDMDPCAVVAARRRIRWPGFGIVAADWTNLLSDREFDTRNGYLNGRFLFAECLGMFDYLPDKLTREDVRKGHAEPAYGYTMRKLFATIRPGGMLVVGNYVPNHPDQAYMELGNWPLILRDEEEMERLVHRFGVSSPTSGDTIEFERVEGAEDTQIVMILRKGSSRSCDYS